MPRSYRDGQTLIIGTCSCCPPPKEPTMWHDPNGIIYPYDAEDLAIIEAAERAKLEQDRADCMNMHDE